jgi:hypothetical protein
MKTILGRCSPSSYLLRAGRSGDQIPVGASLYIPVQTGPGAHPDSYKMGSVSFTELEGPERVVGHPPSSGIEVKERV